jgi:hypothetical protein
MKLSTFLGKLQEIEVNHGGDVEVCFADTYSDLYDKTDIRSIMIRHLVVTNKKGEEGFETIVFIMND